MKFEEIFQNCCEQMREATLQGLLAEDAAYLEAVSYTHLDVYKRQELIRSAQWLSTVLRKRCSQLPNG